MFVYVLVFKNVHVTCVCTYTQSTCTSVPIEVQMYLYGYICTQWVHILYRYIMYPWNTYIPIEVHMFSMKYMHAPIVYLCTCSVTRVFMYLHVQRYICTSIWDMYSMGTYILYRYICTYVLYWYSTCTLCREVCVCVCRSNCFCFVSFLCIYLWYLSILFFLVCVPFCHF